MITFSAVVICVLAFLAGLLVLKILCKLLRFSAKILGKLIGNAILGAVILLVFNFIGGLFGLTLSITPLNALLVGVLGVPGVILLLLLG